MWQKECRQLIPHEIIPVWSPAEHSSDRRLTWFKESHHFPTGPERARPFAFERLLPGRPAGWTLNNKLLFKYDVCRPTPWATCSSASAALMIKANLGAGTCLPNWHVLPVHWGGHTHLNPLTKSRQVPPWEQLFGEQSSMSEKNGRGLAI